MADSVPFTGLPPASALDGSEITCVVQAGESRRTTVGAWPAPPPAPVAFSGAGVYQLTSTFPAGDSTAPIGPAAYDTDSYTTGHNRYYAAPFLGFYEILATIEPDGVGTSGWFSAVVMNPATDHLVLGVAESFPAGTTVHPPMVLVAQSPRVAPGTVFVLEVEQSDSTTHVGGVTAAIRFLGDNATPPPPTPPFLLDLFADADGTDILVHIMDVGPGWSLISSAGGSGSIQSNQLEAVTSSVGDTILFSDAGHVDGVATVGMVISIDGGNAGLAFRVVDLSNFWLAHVDLNAGQFQVWKCIAGSFTLLAGASVSPSTVHVYALSLRVHSDTITFGVDAEAPVVVVDSDLEGSTLWGLYIGGELAVNQIFYTTFRVQPL